ncbi:carbohydrate porin [Coraliomargarita algicola]|uniref:Carbohydrate porin n=1 Tax=Coraliomargarita algicola TaxID=3092156 RepID=A0ABZ0RPF3_9BACT|nr:carbohydrate porin [Coraliomargarita sp. J2-16]WPJ97407.1 carbohydrate porin [Coraliomargarita sp. J2-16]
MKIITTTMLIGLTSIAFANGEAWNEREQVTGDWGGLRTSLEDKGIDAFLYYDSIAAASVSGGIQHDDQFTGQVYAGVRLDFEKMFGWDTTTGKISIVNRHGNGISHNVGGIYDPMTINGGADGQVTWLYEVWLEKMFGDNLAIKFGRTSMDEDFANSDLYRYSLSTSINGPIRSMMLDNAQIFSFPLALWGARAKYKISDEHQFQLGAYQINDNPFGTHLKGTDWGIDSDDGVTYMAQYDWTPDVFDRPARFYFGVAHSVYDYTDFDGGESSSMTTVYGHGEVEVAEGLRLFAFGAYNPQEESAKIPLQISGGANWKGLIPGRENDHTVFFATYGQVSDEYGDHVTLADVDSEMVFELGHRIQLTPAFYIQPAVQYIVDPGGGTNGNVDDAFVVGAWIGMSF